MEKRKGGASGVDGRQILEEQSILEGGDHVQICGSEFGSRQRGQQMGWSPPPVSGVLRSNRWTARL